MSLFDLGAVVLLSFAFISALSLSLKPELTLLKNRTLGLSLMIYSLFVLVYFLWFKAGFILKAPFLLRTVNPLMFFALPLFYFYVRNTVKQLHGLQRWDWIHFLPGMLHIVELIPFYAMPLQEKRVIAEQIVQNPHLLDELAVGLIPGNIVDSVRILLQLGYYMVSVSIINRMNPGFLTTVDKNKLQNWLYVSVILMGLLVFSHASSFFLELLSNRGIQFGGIVYQFLLYGILLAIAGLSFYIQYKPEFVYGYHESSSKVDVRNRPSTNLEKNIHINLTNNLQVSEDIAIAENISQVDTNEKLAQFLEEKYYLRQDINASEFAVQIGVSKRQLSAYLKDHYGKGFKEWINYLRVQEAVRKIDEGYLDTFTIESLCMDVGFNSRITFFTVFKKEMGISPSEYAKQKID
ncbi:MAG: helix-turn-helix domain-containing protein [Mongoliitalea sp.]